jgi:segregation and condensation protein A
VVEDRILKMLVEQNEISWKSIIYDLVRQEGMDPWDINVGLIAEKYIETIRGIQQADLKVGGKVVLAAAILLRIKSKKLVGEDLSEFDRLIATGELDQGQFYDELEQELAAGEAAGLADEHFELSPRMPQPRTRKVSIYELMSALEKALEVKHRRINRLDIAQVPMPARKFDVGAAIGSIVARMKSWFVGGAKKLTFTQLLPSQSKKDKVYTFIPLLHLSNQQRIELSQNEHFGEIEIKYLGDINAPEAKEGDKNADEKREAVPEQAG